jgi:hypothetical protein
MSELPAQILSELRSGELQAAELEAGLFGRQAVAQLFNPLFLGGQVELAFLEIVLEIRDLDFLLGDEANVLMQFRLDAV